MADQVTDDPLAPELSFFGDPNIDNVVGMVFTLAMEVSVLTTRLRAAERALGDRVRSDLPDDGAATEREALLNRLLANLRRGEAKARPLVAERLTKAPA